MSFQAEFFVVPEPPPLVVAGRPFPLTGLAFRRTESQGTVDWLALMDMPRAQAFDLEGHLVGVRAVDLIRLRVEPPTRLSLSPDSELSALLEQTHSAQGLGPVLSPELAQRACQAEHYRLESLQEGHPWDRT